MLADFALIGFVEIEWNQVVEVLGLVGLLFADLFGMAIDLWNNRKFLSIKNRMRHRKGHGNRTLP